MLSFLLLLTSLYFARFLIESLSLVLMVRGVILSELTAATYHLWLHFGIKCGLFACSCVLKSFFFFFSELYFLKELS